jgi:hypothetical protein
MYLEGLRLGAAAGQSRQAGAALTCPSDEVADCQLPAGDDVETLRLVVRIAYGRHGPRAKAEPWHRSQPGGLWRSLRQKARCNGSRPGLASEAS